MNIYIFKPTNTVWDETAGMVIIAKDKERAIELAKKSWTPSCASYDENKIEINEYALKSLEEEKIINFYSNG